MLMSADFPDHEKFNLACDAEVNQYIEGLPPDDGHVDIKVLGLPEKQELNGTMSIGLKKIKILVMEMKEMKTQE